MDLFPVFYAGNVAFYRALLKADSFGFEQCEHFSKQTYRNRLEILGPNGIHRLSIPVIKKGRHLPMHRVEINYAEQWQKDHWKSLEAAYRRSPYFEYYEDRFKPFYFQEQPSLMQFNLEMHSLIMNLLSLKLSHDLSSEYASQHEGGIDYREHDFRNPETEFEPYMQVFGDRFPFMANLSILDALFNLGPSARTLLT